MLEGENQLCSLSDICAHTYTHHINTCVNKYINVKKVRYFKYLAAFHLITDHQSQLELRVNRQITNHKLHQKLSFGVNSDSGVG